MRLVLALMLCGLCGCSQAVTAGSASGQPRQLQVQAVDLGLVVAGGREHEFVWVELPSQNQMEIVGVRSGCECVSVRIENMVGEKLVALIEADLSHEPGFVGGLEVKVDLLGRGGVAISQFVVQLRAIPANLVSGLVDAHLTVLSPDSSEKNGEHVR
jgi:hypothetical protein